MVIVYAKRPTLRAMRKLSKNDINNSNSSLSKEDEDNHYPRRFFPAITRHKAQTCELVDVDRKFKDLLIF